MPLLGGFFAVCPRAIDWQAGFSTARNQRDALPQDNQGRGTLLKLRAFNILFEALAVGGRSLLGSKLLVKALGLSKPQKRPLGRLRASGGLCWRMQNICASLGSTSGGSESDWSPGSLSPSGFVDGSGMWRHPK